MDTIEGVVGLDQLSEPLTGWYCSVCDKPAQVIMSLETLCRKHARRWQWGYGEELKAMREEVDKEEGK